MSKIITTMSIVFTIVYISSFLYPANTSRIKSIDNELNKCLKENTSTLGMLRCIGMATHQWDRELNIVYRKLLRKLNSTAKRHLILSQRKWLKFFIEERKFLFKLYYPGRGSMYRISLGFAILELKKSRTLQLYNYLSMNNE